MAYEISPNTLKITLVAGADLSAAQYKFVKLDGSGNAVVCSAITDRAIGVLQNAPLSGQEAEITVSGGTKVVAGGTVAIGGTLSTSTGATAVSVVVGTATTTYIFGTALTGGASGEVITAVVNCAAAGRAS